jgi:hypothetical protein
MVHFLRPVALAAVVLMAGPAAAQTRVETPAGLLTIQTHDEAVQVVVQQGGRRVLLVDESSHQKVVIDAGLFTQKLPGGLTVSAGTFTLKRGEQVVAEVTREPTAPAAVAGVQHRYYYEPVTSYVFDKATGTYQPVTSYQLRSANIPSPVAPVPAQYPPLGVPAELIPPASPDPGLSSTPNAKSPPAVPPFEAPPSKPSVSEKIPLLPPDPLRASAVEIETNTYNAARAASEDARNGRRSWECAAAAWREVIALEARAPEGYYQLGCCLRNQATALAWQSRFVFAGHPWLTHSNPGAPLVEREYRELLLAAITAFEIPNRYNPIFNGDCPGCPGGVFMLAEGLPCTRAVEAAEECLELLGERSRSVTSNQLRTDSVPAPVAPVSDTPRETIPPAQPEPEFVSWQRTSPPIMASLPPMRTPDLIPPAPPAPPVNLPPSKLSVSEKVAHPPAELPWPWAGGPETGPFRAARAASKDAASGRRSWEFAAVAWREAIGRNPHHPDMRQAYLQLGRCLRNQATEVACRSGGFLGSCPWPGSLGRGARLRHQEYCNLLNEAIAEFDRIQPPPRSPWELIGSCGVPGTIVGWCEDEGPYHEATAAIEECLDLLGERSRSGWFFDWLSQ